MRMRRTKIVCTIGPASNDVKILGQMISAGMNVARLNFSHGTHEYHAQAIKNIKKAREAAGVPLAIMLDTKGPEIRLGTFENKSAEIKDGDEIVLTSREVVGGSACVSVSFGALPSQLKAGNRVLINDGAVELAVKECTDTDVICTVVRGGVLTDRKGVNIPSVHIDMPYLSEQDKSDLLFGIENGVDFVAASFVRSKEDMISLRNFINFNGGHDIRLISKIENLEGIENFDEILENSDGIMVARGDMGVEVEYERLPGLQKRFIKSCYRAGKMVITATQMLESMISSSTPTRAEITDVANAVFDGTSAVMLSGETAAGSFPVLAVRVMAKIAEQAETDAFASNAYKHIGYETDFSDMTNAVCDAACTMARDIEAKAIIAPTKYGQTARRMSKFRPMQPVIAATYLEKTYNQLSLSWGVYPVMSRYQENESELFRHAIDCAKMINAVSDGDKVVIAAGIPLGQSGSTNTLRVEIVGEKK